MASVTKTNSSFESAACYSADSGPAVIAVKTWALDDVASGNQPPKAILQMNHGMAEYIDRYDAFAREVAALGWLVVGMDFIGHGDSAPLPEQLGYTGLALPDDRNVFLEDMHTLRKLTQAAYPGVPYFMFGHSMGSFLLRAYLGHNGVGVTGAIISGTGVMAQQMVVMAKGLLGFLGLTHKPNYRSPFFTAMSIGAYNKPFEKAGARTPCDWLSRDNEQVDKYIADPRCGFMFTLAADKLLMDAIELANHPITYSKTPRDLGLLLISGGDDPVGNAGIGVTQVMNGYHSLMKDVTMKLYPHGRHEMLNEINRDEVTADIIAWLEAHLPS